MLHLDWVYSEFKQNFALSTQFDIFMPSLLLVWTVFQTPVRFFCLIQNVFESAKPPSLKTT